MKEKFVVYSWDKMQTAFIAAILILYAAFYGAGLYLAKYDFLLENLTLLVALFIFIVIWVVLSYSRYSINGSKIEISKIFFLKKTKIPFNEISSFQKNNFAGSHPLVIGRITLRLKDGKTEKLDFFSELNSNKLAAKLKEIVKQD